MPAIPREALVLFLAAIRGQSGPLPVPGVMPSRANLDGQVRASKRVLPRFGLFVGFDDVTRVIRGNMDLGAGLLGTVAFPPPRPGALTLSAGLLGTVAFPPPTSGGLSFVASLDGTVV
jgi:hypothetical protein